MTKKIRRIIGIIAIPLILLLIIGFIYQNFFRPVNTGSGNILGMTLFGLIVGMIITFLLFQARGKRKQESETKIESHTIIESIKRVFKIVVAEGQANEIFNYENTKKLLKFIPSTKKALVIVRAKTLIGYDIEKCKWEIDEEKKNIRLINFPKPEILSLETDFNYYYFEDDLFNFIGRNDLQEIQHLAKEQVKKSVLQSGLLKVAADQMKLLLSEIATANNWNVENIELVDDYSYPKEIEDDTQQEYETAILKKENILDKAVSLLKLK